MWHFGKRFRSCSVPVFVLTSSHRAVAGPPPRRVVSVNVVKLEDDQEQATQQGRKRLVKSWDSRKQAFTYHERYDNDEVSNTNWSKDWSQPDSTSWDWNENGYGEDGPRWSKKYKAKKYKAARPCCGLGDRKAAAFFPVVALGKRLENIISGTSRRTRVDDFEGCFSLT